VVRLNNEETKKILFFQQITGAAARDCVEDNEIMVFVVAEGDIGRAIGKGGRNIGALERAMRKKVVLIEYSSDPIKFTENIFFPTSLKVSIDDKKVTIAVDNEERKHVIGKEVKKIKLARMLLERHFGINEIKV
jgi:N utilization substance protein A